MTEFFKMKLSKIQPSQLYISQKKLASIENKLQGEGIESLEPVPVKKLGDEIIYTDGHTRAFLAFQKGYSEITVEWETEDLDWEMYEICVQWCKDKAIFSIADLEKRLVTHKEYEIVWYKKCDTLHAEIAEQRKSMKVKLKSAK